MTSEFRLLQNVLDHSLWLLALLMDNVQEQQLLLSSFVSVTMPFIDWNLSKLENTALRSLS